MGERLQKVLSAYGVASRREAERMIVAGRVGVNGRLAALGDRVEATDQITVDGQILPARAPWVYLAMNKPPGVVTTMRGRPGERTVVELLPPGVRLPPAGRLDKDTSGLLLLSNDGEWRNLVTHPRYAVEKEYEVLVSGQPAGRALERMRMGVEIEPGVTTSAARVEVLGSSPNAARLSVTVMEGKKRQIRLMAAAVGHPVLALRRVRIGAIRLDGLAEGRWRPLRWEEVESIRVHARGVAGDGSPPVHPDRHRRTRRRG